MCKRACAVSSEPVKAFPMKEAGRPRLVLPDLTQPTQPNQTEELEMSTTITDKTVW